MPALIGPIGTVINMNQAVFANAMGNPSYASQLVVAEGTGGQAQIVALYNQQLVSSAPAALTATVINNLFINTASGVSQDNVAAITLYLNNAFAQFPATKGQIISNLTTILGGLENDAAWGGAAVAFNNASAADYAYSTNPANINAGSASTTSTFTLTTGIDLIDITGANVANINGLISPDNGITGAVTATVNTGDVINGNTKVDTLNITTTGFTSTNNNLIELNSVDVVNVRALDNTDINAALWTGTTTINSIRSLSFLEVNNVANAVTMGMTSTDQEFDLYYTANALGSITANQAFTFNGVETSGIFGAYVQSDGTDRFTTVTINAVGAESSVVVDLYNGGAFAYAELETVIVTGSAAIGIEFGLGDNDATLVTFNASANIGGVTYDASTANATLVTLTGGTGNDEFTVDGTDADAVINLGAGDDQLNAGLGDLIDAATINGGTGTDTISLAAVTLGNAALIANFENLELTSAAGTYEANLFTASTFSGLVIDGALGGATTITGLAGTNINVAVNAVADEDITASLASSTATTNALNLTFGAAAATIASLQVFTSTGIDTIAIVSGGEDDTVVGNAVGAYRDTLNTLTTITITGANDFEFGGVQTNRKSAAGVTSTVEVASSLTSINGSAATGNLDITAGASTSVAGATQTETTTYNSLTISTGTGDDVIAIGGRGTANTGTGIDRVEVAVLGVSVNFGVDNTFDEIILGASADFANTASGSVITAGGFTATTRVTTVTNMGADDEIDFAGPLNTLATTVNNFNVAAATKTSLVAAINAAIVDTTSDYDFFTFSGNTYLVGSDVTAATTSVATVVKLVGTYADFTVVSDVVLLG